MKRLYARRIRCLIREAASSMEWGEWSVGTRRWPADQLCTHSCVQETQKNMRPSEMSAGVLLSATRCPCRGGKEGAGYGHFRAILPPRRRLRFAKSHEICISPAPISDVQAQRRVHWAVVSRLCL